MLHEVIGQGNIAVVTLHAREAIEPADWLMVLRKYEIAGGTRIEFQSASLTNHQFLMRAACARDRQGPGLNGKQLRSNFGRQHVMVRDY